MPYVIYYEPKYEIGMDLAIIVFFLLAGVMEYSISSFSRYMEYHQQEERKQLWLDPLSLWVCVIGSLGYMMLTLGMLNILYMYTLNQHKKPVILILVSLLVNVTVGVFCSRWISYEYSAIGMLVGSTVFAILSTFITYKFFKKLDYYYYAAY